MKGPLINFKSSEISVLFGGYPFPACEVFIFHCKTIPLRIPDAGPFYASSYHMLLD